MSWNISVLGKKDAVLKELSIPCKAYIDDSTYEIARQAALSLVSGVPDRTPEFLAANSWAASQGNNGVKVEGSGHSDLSYRSFSLLVTSVRIVE